MARLRWFFASLTIGTLYGSPAAAESALPQSFKGHIAAVFSGTPDCPDSDYVLLESDTLSYAGKVDSVVVLDHCGAAVGAFGDPVEFEFASSAVFLIARPDAEQLFGVKADMSASSPLPAPNGALEYGDSKIIYGDYPGANAPALPPGKALKWGSAGWEIGDPLPIVGNCGSTEAGSVAGAAGASDSGGSSDAGYPPCSGGMGGGTGGFGNETGNGGMTSEAGPNDADIGKHPASSEDSRGCSCHLGMSNSDRFVAALVLAALGVTFRRAFRR